MVLFLDAGALSLVYWAGVLTATGALLTIVNSSGDADSSYIRRAKRGDDEAFAALVERYQKKLYFVVIRIVLDHDDANDVVQDTFIKAYQNLTRFDENYRFYTWLYRIAVNTSLNCIQSRRRRGVSLDARQEESRFDPPAEFDGESDYAFRELREQVVAALEYLSPKMRTVFVLRVFEEMSYKEIADTLDISPGTVMSRLNRARSALKKCLEKTGGDSSGNT